MSIAISSYQAIVTLRMVTARACKYNLFCIIFFWDDVHVGYMYIILWHSGDVFQYHKPDMTTNYPKNI